jgi:UDP-3-O-[3-hydroxymyristoyl] glucosamine N-acyltransferase
MAEPFFFRRGTGLTVGEIISLTGAKPRPGADLNRRISGIAALDHAGPTDLTFFDNAR